MKNNLFKKSISLILSLVMITSTFASVSMTTYAANKSSDNLYWLFERDTSTLTISGKGNMSNYTSSTSAPWNEYRLITSKIIIDSGVTSIGNYAFSSFSSLKTVTMPDTVVSVGDYAFYSDTSLEYIQMSNNIVTIGQYAFYGIACRELKLPNTLQQIGSSAFRLSSIVNITIPEGITQIPDYAFYNSTLAHINLPSTLLTIGQNAFSHTCFKTLQIPASLTTIGASAFSDSALSSIVLPESLTSIGNSAFFGTKLSTIAIPSQITTIPENAFKSSMLESVQFTDKVTEISQGAFSNTRIKNVVLPANLQTLGEYAFSNSLLETVVFPSSLETIDSYSFRNCPLDSESGLVLSEGLTDINESAFAGCQMVTVSLPSTLKTISNYAFANTEYLQSVYIPANVEYIGNYAFDASGVSAFVVDANNPTYASLDGVIFSADMTKLIRYPQAKPGKIYTVPASVNDIGTKAFSACMNLKSVSFAGNPTNIGGSAFLSCFNLESIDIPDSVNTIGTYAFSKCYSLDNVRLPNSLSTIPSRCFEYCYSLSSIDIPESVRKIDSYAFQFTHSLSNIDLPESLTTLSTFAFANCTSLEGIRLPNNIATIPRNTFTGCGSLSYIFIPSSVTAAYQDAFTNCPRTAIVFYDGDEVSWKNVRKNYSSTGFFGKCTIVFNDEQYNNCNHNDAIATKTDYVAPTCTEAGSYNVTISCDCGYSSPTIENTISELGHVDIDLEGYDETCEEDGLTDGKYCFFCKEITKVQFVIPAEHKLVAVPGHQSSCNIKGLTNGIVCSRCGYVETEQTEIDCCHYPITIPYQAPTCYENGHTEGSYCGYCQTVLQEQEDIPKLYHSYVVPDTVYPTCTKDGHSGGLVCDKCGDVYIEPQVLPATGHSFTNYVNNNDATCKKNATRTAYCDNGCGTFDVQEIEGTMLEHRIVTIPAKEPTCKSTGNTEGSYCTRCGDYFVPIQILESEHKFENYVSDGNATCGTDGTKTAMCKFGCGTSNTIVDVGSATGNHQVVELPAVEPTCESVGYTAGSKCSVCGNILVEQQVIPKLEHSFTNYILFDNATCLKNETKIAYCDYGCGAYNILEIEGTKLAHAEIDIPSLQPTCQSEGHTAGKKCIICGTITLGMFPIPTVSHSFTNYVLNDNADCFNNATKTAYCDYGCGESDDVEVEGTMLEHVIVEIPFDPPTCTEPGYTKGKECSLCGEILQEPTLITPVGHRFTDYISNNDATCHSDGTVTRTCLNCGLEETTTDYGSTLEHIGVLKYTVDATCVDDGYSVYECALCGDEYLDDETICLGHDFGEFINNDDATCFNNATRSRTCSRCGEVETESIEGTQLTHNYSISVSFVAPTCTEYGYTSGKKCEHCGDIINRNVIEPIGHRYTNYVSNNDATCTTQGTKSATCAICGHIDTVLDETANPSNHNYVSTIVPPTCTDKGYTLYVCQNCGASYRDNFTPSAHTYGEFVSNNDSTCQTDGTKTAVCTVCGDTITVTDENSKSPHDLYLLYETPSTETTQGYSIKVCTECGEYVQEKLPYIKDSSVLDAVMNQISSYSAEDFSSDTYDSLRTLYEQYVDFDGIDTKQSEIDYAVSQLLTAMGELKPYLQLSVCSPNGDFTVQYDDTITSQESHSLLFGTTVTVSTKSKIGYDFIGWFDTHNNRYFSNELTYSFKITENTELMAVFVKEDSATLTFTTYSNWVKSTVTKTIAEWNSVESIAEFLPDVPYRYGYSNGRWVYDDNQILAKLRTGESVSLIPQYDKDNASVPEPPVPTNDAPVIELYYKYNEEAKVGTFLMATGIPENCNVESVGTVIYYDRKDSFDPTKFELFLNNRIWVSKFSDYGSKNVFITNIRNMDDFYNWAARGYVTYTDKNGNVKTVYSNQVNVINTQEVG